jgi:ABC-2 type transport system permease protein
VPSDGSVSSLRAVVERLDAESVAVAGLTVETPDLDDVFLALTGRDEHRLLRAARLGDDAARNLRRTLRYPASAAATVGVPLVFLLLFVFVFGDTLGAGLTGVSGGRDEYLDYVTPGILLLAAASAAQGVAISVAMDMTEGIVARFRTMDIARVSVLTGHVAGSLIQTMIAIAVVLGVALALGFGPTAGPLDWIAAIGLLAMITFALIWVAVALGLVTKSVETASNLPMPLILLPFLGSGFVPTESMPAGMRQPG